MPRFKEKRSTRSLRTCLRVNKVKRLRNVEGIQDFKLRVPPLKFFSPDSETLNLRVELLEFMCQDCLSIFKNENDLREHQIFVHAEFRSLKSVRCFFTFKVVDTPTTDSLSHTGAFGSCKDEIGFDLNFDDEPHENEETLTSNTTILSDDDIVDGENESLTGEDPENFDKKLDLRLGDVDRSDIYNKSFECDKCSKSFSDGSSLDKHISLFNSICDESYNRVIKCLRCESSMKRFLNFSDLHQHLILSHSDCRNVECLVCFALMNSHQELLDHSKVGDCELKDGLGDLLLSRHDHHQTTSPNKHVHVQKSTTSQHVDSSSLTKCSESDSIVCDEEMGQQDDKIPSRKRKEFKCHLCGNQFTKQRHLEYHVKSTHNKIKDLVCPICSRPFSKQSFLTDHLNATHYKLKNYQCAKCPYRALKRCHLDRHTRLVHEKVRPFGCDLCSDKYFASKVALNYHVKSFHNKIYDQMCSVCGKAFACNRRLMLHIRKVHEKIHDYRCSHCKKIFDNKESLSDHLITSHDGLANYQCSQCSMTTLFLASLKKHVKNVHGSVGGEKKSVGRGRGGPPSPSPPDPVPSDVNILMVCDEDGQPVDMKNVVISEEADRLLAQQSFSWNI